MVQTSTNKQVFRMLQPYEFSKEPVPNFQFQIIVPLYIDSLVYAICNLALGTERRTTNCHPVGIECRICNCHDFWGKTLPRSLCCDQAVAWSQYYEELKLREWQLLILVKQAARCGYRKV